MTLREVKVLLHKQGVPDRIKGEVIAYVTPFIQQELDVEILVKETRVDIDIYDGFGKREGGFSFKLKNAQEPQNPETEKINEIEKELWRFLSE